MEKINQKEVERLEQKIKLKELNGLDTKEEDAALLKLAAEYIEKYHVSPPVLFADLMSLDMDPVLRTAIEDLLEIKKQTTEKEENPQIPVIREFIESEIAKQKAIADEIPDDHNKDWKALNRLFAEIIAKNV